MRLLRHSRGNPDPEYVEAYPTAPPLDSTHLRIGGGSDSICGSSAEFAGGFQGDIPGKPLIPRVLAISQLAFFHRAELRTKLNREEEPVLGNASTGSSSLFAVFVENSRAFGSNET